MWKKALLLKNSIIQDVIYSLEASSMKIVIVIDENERLIGTISDGDIRRGLIRGLGLKSPISEILNFNSLVAPPGLNKETARKLMLSNKVSQIPIIDEFRVVQGIYLWDELSLENHYQNLFVVMAGGYGKRLAPLTDECPKPLLKVSGKPILEHIIMKAKGEGYCNFVLIIQHLGEMVEEYFGDGEKWGINITYVKEDRPLGTAGGLSLIEPLPNQSILVTNGDVLTDVSYSEVMKFHENHSSIATMVIRKHEYQNQFGVVRTNGLDIVGFEEKPVLELYINAGIYVLSPDVIKGLQKNISIDMPSVFMNLKKKAKKIIAYPIHEPWLDIGRLSDYEKAKTLNVKI